MKVLLDENLPHQLRLEIVGHDIFTVAFMGWSGVENGQLLQEAKSAGFDAFVTNDRGLEYEQDTTSLPVAVVVILPTTNTIESIRQLLPTLQSILARLAPCEFVKVVANP
ncbi:MAG: DUF5615 family PIN-like protein [Pirellulales bacterium]